MVFFNIGEKEYLPCNLSFCLHCAKKLYKISSKKGMKLCPKCEGNCYCLNCEFKDHYIRLFRLFANSDGDLKTFRHQSLIDRIFRFYLKEKNSKKIHKISRNSRKRFFSFTSDLSNRSSEEDFNDFENQDKNRERKIRGISIDCKTRKSLSLVNLYRQKIEMLK